MTWAQVEEAMPKAKGIAWDGCHKIYLAMDDGQVEAFLAMGYGSHPRTVFGKVTRPKASMRIVRDWFRQGCGLEFVSAVSSKDGDKDEPEFENLIAQFEAHTT